MLNCFSRVWLFATPWTVACQAPLCMEILQGRTLEWVTRPSSRGSSWPRDWTHVSHGSCFAGGFFTTEPPGKPEADLDESNLTTNDVSSWRVLCCEGCPVQCRMVASLYPLHTSGTTLHMVTAKNVPRHCKMVPGGKISRFRSAGSEVPSKGKCWLHEGQRRSCGGKGGLVDFEGESEVSWEKAGFFGTFQIEGNPGRGSEGQEAWLTLWLRFTGEQLNSGGTEQALFVCLESIFIFKK